MEWSPYSREDDERVKKELKIQIKNDDSSDLRESARLWIELGRVYERRNDTKKAKAAYRKSIDLDNGTVTGRLQLANSIRLSAVNQDDLDEAEKILKEASRITKERSTRPPLLDAEEAEDAKVLHDVLLLLICQSGDKRDNEAQALLVKCGYKYRLSKHALCYPLVAQKGPWAPDVPYVKSVDDVLPPEMLEHMQTAYNPNSLFWSEHNYSQVTPYFSYIHPIRKTSAAMTTSLDQVIHWIYEVACTLVPKVREATKAEWWAHCRPHGSGHQLHFDSDNEGNSREGGKPRHPIASTVLYLSEGVGGPTLVTNQRLGDPLATQGWLVHPKINRLVVFDGTVLHGVIPGRGLPVDSQSRRTTFMVAFWKEVQVHKAPNEMPGSSRPFPEIRHTRFQWPKIFANLGPDEWNNPPTNDEDLKHVIPMPIRSVWDSVRSDINTSTPKKHKAIIPSYEECFQGF